MCIFVSVFQMYLFSRKYMSSLAHRCSSSAFLLFFPPPFLSSFLLALAVLYIGKFYLFTVCICSMAEYMTCDFFRINLTMFWHVIDMDYSKCAAVNHVANGHFIALVIVVILTSLHQSTIRCCLICSIIFYKEPVSFAYILEQAEMR